MKDNSPKLRHTHQEELASEQEHRQKIEAKEFATVEELLRHDANETVVPPEIAIKLDRSIVGKPGSQPKTGWRRFFGNK